MENKFKSYWVIMFVNGKWKLALNQGAGRDFLMDDSEFETKKQAFIYAHGKGLKIDVDGFC